VGDPSFLLALRIMQRSFATLKDSLRGTSDYVGCPILNGGRCGGFRRNTIRASEAGGAGKSVTGLIWPQAVIQKRFKAIESARIGDASVELQGFTGLFGPMPAYFGLFVPLVPTFMPAGRIFTG
jgi:hypothetical protein